jgi:hypothetical protein
VDFLRRADLPETVKEDIAHRNAERLLGVRPAPGAPHELPAASSSALAAER